MKRLLLSIIVLAITSNAYSMRCKGHLIMEGDSASKVTQYCGNPTQQSYSYMLYKNKDGDGMDYKLHINGAGMIDSITSERGVL